MIGADAARRTSRSGSRRQARGVERAMLLQRDDPRHPDYPPPVLRATDCGRSASRRPID